MTAFSVTTLVLLPIGLGLMGFIEPCSLGSTLLVVQYLEGKSAAAKLAQVSLFAGTRVVVIGLLGMLAAVLGGAFLGLQGAAWMVLGAFYALLGIVYVVGKAGVLSVSLGPSLARLSNLRRSAGLGALFGLNMPACAAPLLVPLLGVAAAGGAAGATPARGFIALALFGVRGVERPGHGVPLRRGHLGAALHRARRR